MNRIFVACDGDDAGSQVGRAVLHDDIQALSDISSKIDQGSKLISNWVQGKGGKIISIGGDEMTAMFENISDEESLMNEMEDVRAQYADLTGMTVTIGAGLSLSQAGKALLAGKLSGKNQILIYDENTDDVLSQAHENVAAGDGSEEEQKLDDHYIDDIQEDDQQQPEGMDMEMDPSDESEMEGFDEDEMYDEESDESPEMTDEELLEQNSLLQEDGEEQSDDMAQPESEEMQDPEMEDAPMEDAPMEDAPMEDDLAQDDMMMAPEDQDADFQSEEEIEIPESEEMQEDNQEPSEEAEKADDADMFNEMAQDPNPQIDELQEKCAAVLEAFKSERQNIEDMKQMAPQLYDATIGMLQCMIEMSKMLFAQPQEEEIDMDPEMEMEPEMEEAQDPSQVPAEAIPKQ